MLVVGIQFLIERSAFGDEARSIVERLDRSRNVDQHALALHIGRLALHSHVELFESLLRRGDWKALPPDMPLFAELTDPSERTVFRRMFTTGADGLAEVCWKVPEDAPAGRYRLDVRTPDGRGMDVVLGSAAVRVEEFQPDTMALALSLSPESGRGWLRASSASANVTLRNLFGTPAADRRVRGQLSVWSAPLSFAGYGDFTFHDAVPYRGSPLTLELGETRTDAEGRASLPLPLEKLRGGTLHCSVLVEGFEAGGGRSVTEELDFLLGRPLLRTVIMYGLDARVRTDGGISLVQTSRNVREEARENLR